MNYFLMFNLPEIKEKQYLLAYIMRVLIYSEKQVNLMSKFNLILFCFLAKLHYVNNSRFQCNFTFEEVFLRIN